MAIKSGDDDERVFMSRKFLAELTKCSAPFSDKQVQLSGHLHDFLVEAFRGR